MILLSGEMSCFFGFQLVFVDCGPAMACPRLLAPSHVLPPTCYSAQLLIWYCFRYITPLWYCLACSHVFPRTHSFRAGLTGFLHLLLTSYPRNVCTPWQGTGVLCIIRHFLFNGSEHVFLQDVCMHVIDWYNGIFMAKTYLILNTIEKYSWEHFEGWLHFTEMNEAQLQLQTFKLFLLNLVLLSAFGCSYPRYNRNLMLFQ